MTVLPWSMIYKRRTDTFHWIWLTKCLWNGLAFRLARSTGWASLRSNCKIFELHLHLLDRERRIWNPRLSMIRVLYLADLLIENNFNYPDGPVRCELPLRLRLGVKTSVEVTYLIHHRHVALVPSGDDRATLRRRHVKSYACGRRHV